MYDYNLFGVLAPDTYGDLLAEFLRDRIKCPLTVLRGVPTIDHAIDAAPDAGAMMAERNGGSGTSPPIPSEPAGELHHNVPTLDEDGAKPINEQMILGFLDQTHGDRPRHLVAINPEGGAPISKTFEHWDIGGLGKWVATMNGKRHWGIYYHVNTLGADCHDQKAKKADIVEARFTHVDVDDADAAERIKAFDPAPTVTVFSGGGFNCLWRIEPTADQATVETVNKAIGSALKADDCYNIDRVLRLPGTMNYPNAVKKTKGRVPTQAYVVDDLTDWTRDYGLAAFDHLPKPTKPEPKTRRTSKEAQCTLRADSDDIDPQTWDIICNGAEEGERSDKFFEAVSDLKTLGYSKGDIGKLLADYPNGIAEKYQGRLEAQVEICFDKIEVECASPEDRLAWQFAARYQDKVVYVAKWGKWFTWNGFCWKEDERNGTFHKVRNFVRSVEARINKTEGDNSKGKGKGAKIVNVKFLSAVEKLVKADPRVTGSTDQWDTDPWMLNTPAGIIDLRTGEIRAAKPGDYCLKVTGFSPAIKGTPCPRFMTFLKEIMPDAEMIAFLKRALGYSLTGVTDEQAIFFHHGEGANGKSVLDTIIGRLLGGYHKTAAIETFTQSHNDQHLTFVAGLHGARFVSVPETEANRHWAEAKIKRLTGGDPVQANFMRHDPFEFVPIFKPHIFGNNKPHLSNVGVATRRRFNLIPYDVIIPETERNKKLPAELLEAEGPAILRWLIDGCLEWQRQGLGAPAKVRDATNQYFAAEDLIQRWLDDRTELDRDAWTASVDIFADFADWAKATGEASTTMTRLIEDIVKKCGFKSDRRRRNNKENPAKGLCGLKLLPRVACAL